MKSSSPLFRACRAMVAGTAILASAACEIDRPTGTRSEHTIATTHNSKASLSSAASDLFPCLECIFGLSVRKHWFAAKDHKRGAPRRIAPRLHADSRYQPDGDLRSDRAFSQASGQRARRHRLDGVTRVTHGAAT